MDGALPLGQESVATVPLLGVWSVWWNCDRLTSLYSGYWNAPIFYPSVNSFTFSETMPISAVAAPLVWSTGKTVLSYNLLLLVALILNGYSAFRLLARMLQDMWVAATSGAIVVLLPLVHHELGVPQLVGLFGILWTLHAAVRLLEKPTFGRAVLLGVSFAVTYFLCNYYGLFLALLLLCCGGWLVGQIGRAHV